MKIGIVRRVVIALAFLAVVVGLVLNAGTGTFSSFGWQAIAAICPLGSLESFFATGTMIPRALIVLALTVLLVALFGKVFCSWFCPMVPLRSLFNPKNWKKFLRSKGKEEAKIDAEPAPEFDPSGSEAIARDDLKIEIPACGKDCSTCATKRAKLDSRHIVLGGTLLSAAIFGFPVFCLICPIGLTFGTVIILWQFIGFEEISLSLLIYPAVLLLELLVVRKWCAKFCPLGALLSLMSLPNRFFRPKVDSSKCLRDQGLECSICCEVCPEDLDPHYAEGMNECSKCGICVDKCPASALSIPLRSKDKAELAPDTRE